MFDKEYSFRGKHADMVKDLKKEFDNKKNKLFEHNYDVYKLAPVIGFLYQRKADIDTSNSNTTKIFPETLLPRQDDFWFNYRMIMLLDREYEPDKEKRIEKAFRGIENKEDEALYESYVRGGVEVLYEKLMEDVKAPDEYVTRLYDFLEDFDTRYHQSLDMGQVLELCRKAKV